MKDEVGNRVRQAGEVVQEAREVCIRMYMFVCTCKLT